jgi:hypothetical protein
MTSLELCRRHKPILPEFLQVTWGNGGRSQILLRHGSRRKGRQHLEGPGIFSYFLLFRSLLFPSIFLFSGAGKEVRREWRMVRREIGVRKGDRQFEPRDIGGQATGPSQT